MNRVQKVPNEVENLTDKEIIKQSQNCEYVNKKIAKDLKVSRKTLGIFSSIYKRNDNLITLLSNTSCFKGNAQEQILKVFGAPSERSVNEDGTLIFLDYIFEIDGKHFYKLTCIFENDELLTIRKGSFDIITVY